MLLNGLIIVVVVVVLGGGLLITRRVMNHRLDIIQKAAEDKGWRVISISSSMNVNVGAQPTYTVKYQDASGESKIAKCKFNFTGEVEWI